MKLERSSAQSTAVQPSMQIVIRERHAGVVRCRHSEAQKELLGFDYSTFFSEEASSCCRITRSNPRLHKFTRPKTPLAPKAALAARTEIYV